MAIFAARFIVVLGVFIFPWPGLGRKMSGVFTDLVGAAAGPLLGGPKGAVTFLRAPETAADGDWDSVLLVKNAQTGIVVDGAAVDIRRVWYLPSAVFVALCFALPLHNARRMAILLLIGLVTLPLLSLLPVVSFLAQIHVLELGVVAHAALDIAYRALVAPLGMAFAVPCFWWFTLVSLFEPLRPAFAAPH
jgi:hypothetical protein